MSDDRLHSSCWCRIDPGPAFLLPEGSTQASAVVSRRTTEGLGTKNKKDGRVLGCHFLSGKPCSDGSHPDFAPCVVHASAKRPAVSLAGRLGQFKLSVGHYPIENHRLGIALPELYL